MATSRRVTQPRSRNGCITCKIRHVKCDEEKPACTQCQKSGRRCDGYDNASQTQLRQRINERHRPIERDTFRADQRLVLPQETRTERRYVEFFYTKTSHVFSGLYESKLWSYLIPQFGEHEPSVRHAMTAIGAIHSRLQITEAASTPEATGPTEQFALEEYNKSIQGLVKSLSVAKGGNVDLALTSCCLFVCLEMLRNKRKAALDHIEAGVRIIYKHEQTSAARAWSSELYQQLRGLFIRLNLQASFMGRTLVPLKLYSSETIQSGLPFDDMIEARNHLDQVITRGLLFIRSVGIMREAREPAFQLELEMEQEKVHQELLAWRQSHDKLLHKLGPKIQQLELCASLLQRIYYYTALIWTLVVLDRSEDAYDNFTSEFESVVSHTEQLLQINPSFGNGKTHISESQPSFSLEGGIIAPVYFACCRCRHPSVRRRAQNILSNYSSREGMWNARLHAAIAKRVMQMEENQCAVPPTSERDILSLARVYEEVQIREEWNNPMHVVMYTKPDGIDGPWKMTSVMVDW